ncbi:hypothetical protein NBZ79_07095 [Sneathiella marina]|uniref:Uncharacterized protein n=1 Tax=Sneathiella marina TaxID=2950108 RepID=A0ABY4W6E9_9PROT|nr:hypothetical protein [Sneathiella marina]USG62742.1 hypothetical protein NBZ79_07095 [Sneathiella marina]
MLLVVLFIRAVSGHKQASVSEKSVRDFLKSHEPHLHISKIQIGENALAAIVFWKDTEEVGLVRSFGDKLVLQVFGQADIIRKSGNDGYELVKFPRQGLAHSATTIRLSAPSRFQSSDPSSEGARG